MPGQGVLSALAMTALVIAYVLWCNGLGANRRGVASSPTPHFGAEFFLPARTHSHRSRARPPGGSTRGTGAHREAPTPRDLLRAVEVAVDGVHDVGGDHDAEASSRNVIDGWMNAAPDAG